MKVRCIDKGTWNNIEVGKEYDMIGISYLYNPSGEYLIRNDSDHEVPYEKSLFIELQDDEKIEDIDFDDSNHPSDTVGIKYDQDKLDWSLLPWSSLADVVEILELGVKKYSRDNWKSVLPKERYLKASLRHLLAYADGERNDTETGKSHLAHCVCCLLFLIWHDKKGV